MTTTAGGLISFQVYHLKETFQQQWQDMALTLLHTQLVGQVLQPSDLLHQLCWGQASQLCFHSNR